MKINFFLILGLWLNCCLAIGQQTNPASGLENPTHFPAQTRLHWENPGSAAATDLSVLTPAQLQSSSEAYQQGVLIFRVKGDYQGQTLVFDVNKTSNLPAYAQTLIQRHRVMSVKPASRFQDPVLARYYKMYFTGDVAPLMADLSALPFVEMVEQLPMRTRTAIPNDFSPNQWYHEMINARNAWLTTNSTREVVVAVIDDGLRTDHEDLAANLWVNPREIARNGIDDDRNGYIDDVHGWDFSDSDPDVFPPLNKVASFSHGTLMAGVLGAVTNNGRGIAALASNVRIMPLKVTPDIGTGTAFATEDYLAAIEYAVLAGAKVINFSASGQFASNLEQEVIRAAHQMGVLVVVAAGNNATNSQTFPAAMDYVLSVGATDQQDQVARFSTYGSWVDVFAPGVKIYTTDAAQPNSYDYVSGTSPATALVSGLAALLWSINPGLSNGEVERIIKAGAININNFNPTFIGQLGAGRIDAGNSAMMAEAPNFDIALTARSLPSGICLNQQSIEVVVSNTGQTALTHAVIAYQVNELGIRTVTIDQMLLPGRSTAIVVPIPELPTGTYTLRVFVSSANRQPFDQNPANNQLNLPFYIPVVSNVSCGIPSLGSTGSGRNVRQRYCNDSVVYNGPEVWHRIVLTERRNLAILALSRVPMKIVVYPACAAGDVCLAQGVGSTLVPDLSPGAYYIVLEGPGTASVDYNLVVQCSPINDCKNPIPVRCGVEYKGNILSGSTDAEFNTCTNRFNRGVALHHRFTLDQPGNISALITSSTNNFDLSLTPACGLSNCIASGDESLSATNLPAGTYHLVVTISQERLGATPRLEEYGIRVDCNPVNNCNSAVSLACGGRYEGNTRLGQNNFNRYGQNNTLFTGPELIHNLRIDAPQTVILELQTESTALTAFLLESCNPNEVLASGNRFVVYQFSAPGVYPVVVDGVDGRTGRYTLIARCLTCPAEALALGCGSTVRGNTFGGTRVMRNYANVGFDLNGPEMVYAVTLAEPGSLTATLSNTSADLDVVILSGCRPDQAIAYGDAQATVRQLPAGLYYVVVDGENNAAGSFNLTIECGRRAPDPCENFSVRIDPGQPTICRDGNIRLVATPSGGEGVYTYSWSPTTALSNPLSADPIVFPRSTTRYAVTVVSGRCTTTADVNVNVVAPPMVSFAPIADFCEDTPPAVSVMIQNIVGDWRLNYTENGMAQTISGNGPGTFALRTTSQTANSTYAIQSLDGICNLAFTPALMTTVNFRRRPLLTTDIVSNVTSSGGRDGRIRAACLGACDCPNGYAFSINGSPFSAETTFTGLTAGDYRVVIRDNCTGCTNSSNVIRIEQPAFRCPATMTEVSNVTASTALVSWMPVTDALFYTVQYRVQLSSQWTSETVTSPSNSLFLRNLRSGVNYEARVQSMCGSRGNGEWSNVVLFSTPATGQSCSIPQNVTILPELVQANLAWNAVIDATSYRLRWWQNVPGAAVSAINVTGTTFTIPNLMPGTDYIVQIRTNCGTAFSGFGTHSFRTRLDKTTGLVEVNGQTMQLYPNPNAGQFELSFTANRAAVAHTALIDMNGKNVMARQFTIEAGENLLTIEGVGLADGVYVFELNLDGEVYRERVMIFNR
jgi:subtilisin family serine protease